MRHTERRVVWKRYIWRMNELLVVDDPLPLARGYDPLGTDLGLQEASCASNAIGEFGLPGEMLATYGYATYRKVHSVAGRGGGAVNALPAVHVPPVTELRRARLIVMRLSRRKWKRACCAF